MERANWHTYQVLTKRSSRLRDMLQTRLQFAASLPQHLVGRQRRRPGARPVRIKHLQEAPAAVRFLSIEPLLEDLGEINLEGIHWVIVGGESGAGARPMQKEWVLSLQRSMRTIARFRSFSNSGAASIRVRPAENLTARRTTAYPVGCNCRFSRTRGGLRRSPSLNGLYNPGRPPPGPSLFPEPGAASF